MSRSMVWESLTTSTNCTSLHPSASGIAIPAIDAYHGHLPVINVADSYFFKRTVRANNDVEGATQQPNMQLFPFM
ncbi:Hypothetical predicted protein [Mytilus galloprovincialis]|uniref:Uncharacterized protein n=1 Tax=Mytilus galloprovincialis TaxID=29158 RepID=A0A8B6C4V7_MYTGA|nr:Hypothetical predicted protein [Mytilus galloprovincialis]